MTEECLMYTMGLCSIKLREDINVTDYQATTQKHLTYLRHGAFRVLKFKVLLIPKHAYSKSFRQRIMGWTQVKINNLQKLRVTQ